MTIRDTELPVWMKRALRRTDWGVLLALAFSVLAGGCSCCNRATSA